MLTAFALQWHCLRNSESDLRLGVEIHADTWFWCRQKKWRFAEIRGMHPVTARGNAAAGQAAMAAGFWRCQFQGRSSATRFAG